ncbi:Dyp-type peroxidase [Bimuria novae-zelandiae CBS 107.79]|uniref:Dyp-type peroxidase n=1 Tax=Bimuria novae-zelandiae CBS 107.79 TaxID=1447943 RepID=A0A6A5UJX4_9PLEO|nr:Dyp-type peroxidase [Bimuria novae-zelandiae CBS 107.79]
MADQDQDFQLSNVQGDILIGLSKITEIFYFFQITNPAAFQSQLPNLTPLITTADKATGEKEAIRAFKVRKQQKLSGIITGDVLPVVGVNIAFSQKGLVKLGVIPAGTDALDEPLFAAGQKSDAFALADKGVGDSPEKFTPDWDEAFLQQTHEIHGVLLVTGGSFDMVNDKLDAIKAIFTVDNASSIAEVATLAGDVRPGKEKGHEHFGYKDGISQPAIKGVDDVDGKKPLPGQTLVDLGVALVGRGKDVENHPKRAPWAKDGSFLAFRKLPQFVPEFDKFLVDNSKPIEDDFPDAPNPADILGARMVGRWKSGAPLRITPLADDKELADDPLRNNKFKFNPDSQEMCPFAAHIRKMNPRKDLLKFGPSEATVDPHLILRRGIPFGPEVTTEEKLTKRTKYERGLYFVSYQSDLQQGFSFLQKAWANNPAFPFPKNPGVENFQPGFDPIIGQVHGEVRAMTGHNDDATDESLPLERQWVQSKGGEYFFSPSIKALRTVLAGQPEPTPTQ